MNDTVLIERNETGHSAWVEITLNRPDKLNSFNDDMHNAIHEALDAAAADNVRAVLLTGAGRGFCAGQDLAGRDQEAVQLPRPLRNIAKVFQSYCP